MINKVIFIIIILNFFNITYQYDIPIVRPNKLFSDTGIDLKEPEKTFVDCTDALSSWSYFTKESIIKLLNDNYIKSESNILFIKSLIPQIEIIDHSLMLCKEKLSNYNIYVKDEENNIKLDIKNIGNKEIKFKNKEDIEEAINRINELIKEFKYLNDIKKSILNFSVNNICSECKLYSAQISLISILKKLRIIYDSYIQEINNNIDDDILKELESMNLKNLR